MKLVVERLRNENDLDSATPQKSDFIKSEVQRQLPAALEGAF